MASRVPLSLLTRTLRTTTFRAPSRFNSTSSTTTTARTTARVMELASQAPKPSALEAGVPLMWAVCGGLICVAWGRAGERAADDGSVEKLLIV